MMWVKYVPGSVNDPNLKLCSRILSTYHKHLVLIFMSERNDTLGLPLFSFKKITGKLIETYHQRKRHPTFSFRNRFLLHLVDQSLFYIVKLSELL